MPSLASDAILRAASRGLNYIMLSILYPDVRTESGIRAGAIGGSLSAFLLGAVLSYRFISTLLHPHPISSAWWVAMALLAGLCLMAFATCYWLFKRKGAGIGFGLLSLSLTMLLLNLFWLGPNLWTPYLALTGYWLAHGLRAVRAARENPQLDCMKLERIFD